VNAADDELARQRESVVAQRAELGRTISVLADKVDVPARVKAKLGDTADKYAHPEYALAAVVAVSTAVSVVAFTSWWRSRPR
jgi:hypothetical protein